MSEEAGKRLKMLRLGMGFQTIRGFAAHLDVAEDRYDKWEKGKALIPPEVVQRLRDEFGITSDWMYYGEVSGLSVKLLEDLGLRRRTLAAS